MDLKQVEQTAAELLARHGLVGWTFRLVATKRRLGACKHRHKRIEIDAFYAAHNPDAAVHDTLRRGRQSQSVSGRRHGRATTRPTP